MVVAKVTYEELRRQRLEENKKRIEELHLPHLSLALKNSSPTHSPMKQSNPRPDRKKVVVMVRRSNRVANKPAPDYKEAVTFEHFEYSRRICKRSEPRRRDLSDRVYASDAARAKAIAKAEELESSLGDNYPTLLKPMLPSHVSGGFWLGIPVYFCKKYLPRRDETVTLVDEEGEEYPVVYLARKTGLSGGWKGFAVDHELMDGDAVVFQLIRPTVLKVYIVRANSSEEGNDV
ncbi:B3 domain-containing protein Os06g0194400-like [Cornus florida]|uniref:B3 domain-containing protein Os06g0194400-like n=1 Tax=Cornus florida TaxID=4283 RepID=UPI00289A2EE5|nr:B3 domain-containing protein Os06g0194400-like [Cornus florida]